MATSFKTLKSFVTAVDSKSLSAAAQALGTTQPALSQQIAMLESHFNERLLRRSPAGVMPTAAGVELYRHAQLILGQLERAERDVARVGRTLVGPVAVGLATYSTTSILSTPLVKAVRESHPGIGLSINDGFGLILSEMVKTGRMDLALIYAPSQIRGVVLEPLLVEDLYVIAPPGARLDDGPNDAIPLAAIASVDLLLPGRTHYLRQLVDGAFTAARLQPRVVAEIESAATLREAIESGLGATILPRALVSTFNGPFLPAARRIVDPGIGATVSLCTSDHLPLSESARAVRDILRDLVRELVASGRIVGIREPARPAAAP